jgi:outer membrane receptor protein involved in Fe transport
VVCAVPCLARPQGTIDDLKKLTLEELSTIEVTSVSRTSESLGGAAAAIAVLTNEDIRRSGALSIPEALRLIPGFHVARQTSDLWAVNSRGFSSTNSEKLLVLSDTRSIYTPLFSRLLGNKDFDSEKLLLYELGYRAQILESLTVDIAAFYNRYKGLASLEFGTAFTDPSTGKTILPIVNRNLTDGTTQGIETSITFSPRQVWRLSGSHAYITWISMQEGRILIGEDSSTDPRRATNSGCDRSSICHPPLRSM